MRLEGLVQTLAVQEEGWSLDDGVLDFSALLARLADCSDAVAGAGLFHGTLIEALVSWAVSAAEEQGIDTVVLGGGCLLNAHLAQALPVRLGERGLRVLMAAQMPPNDGAISLGQAWVAQRLDLN